MTEQMRIEHICEVFEGWTGPTIRSGYYNTGINFYFLSQHTVGIPAVCFLFLHSIMFEDSRSPYLNGCLFDFSLEWALDRSI